MGTAWAFWLSIGGVSGITAASTAFWAWSAHKRNAVELELVKRAVPSAREGTIVSALALEIQPRRSEAVGWFTELVPQLDVIVAAAGLRRVGAFHGTYMVVGTDERIASKSLHALAQLALDLRDCVALFSAMREVPLGLGCGIHADVVPTVGLGSTVALSQLWSQALSLADRAKDGDIDLSSQSATWLGDDFDIKVLGDRPVLHARRVA